MLQLVLIGMEGAEAMICKIGDRYILVCDICEIEDDETFYDFYDAVEHKKVNGWKSQKYRSEWKDVCLECQKAEDS